MGLGEAATMLGISAVTLRRWADRGQIPSYTTPGGHRRFPVAAITALLPPERPDRPRLERMGTSPDRMASAYRAALAAPGTLATPWLVGLDEGQRELYRERGRRMVECLFAHLDASEPGPAMANLHDASGRASEYGGDAARLGASLSSAVEAFLRFRSPFVSELAETARRRRLAAPETADLLIAAETAMDRLLVSFITGWQTA